MNQAFVDCFCAWYDKAFKSFEAEKVEQKERDRRDLLAGPLRTYAFNGSPVLKKHIRRSGQAGNWMPSGPALSYDGKTWEPVR